MPSRPSLHRTLPSLAVCLGLAVASLPQTAEAETITIGTLAPKQTVWGRVFGVWEEAVKKKSDGKLQLSVFYNGQHGDDATMVGKVRAGQLDGAAVSSIGLGKVHKPILALQLPGVIRDWKTMDKVRDALLPEWQKEAEKEGFLITLGDLGRLRTMTRGFALKRPADLSGKKVVAYRSETLGPVVYQLIPGVSTVPLSPPEILGALKTKSVDVVSAPSLAAEGLQWIPQLTHVGGESNMLAIGGFVFSKKRVDALPGDLRAILTDTGRIAQQALKTKIRSEDEAAFERMKASLTVTTLNEDDKKAWQPIFEKAIERLKQGTFDPKLVLRIKELAK